MKKEFVMRGQTASGETEVLNFSGYKPGYAYRLVEFVLYGSTNIGGVNTELLGSITAGKTAIAPTDPNFNDEALIGVANWSYTESRAYPKVSFGIVNDTFLITQNLILMVVNANAGTPVNWQCRFKPVKLSDTEMANANLRQFHVFDE